MYCNALKTTRVITYSKKSDLADAGMFGCRLCSASSLPSTLGEYFSQYIVKMSSSFEYLWSAKDWPYRKVLIELKF